MSGSLLFEVHAWRGFRTERDLFCVGFVAGFCTLLLSRQSIMETMAEMKRRLEKAKEKLALIN